jgi:WD40 repeat protein
VATLVVPAEGPAGVGKMALSNDHAKLAYGSTKGVIVVDTHSGTVLNRIAVESLDFAFSPDGRLLAVAEIVPSVDGQRNVSSGVHVYTLQDGVQVASIGPAGSSYLGNVRWDPQEGRFLAYSDGKSIHVWNPNVTPSGYTTIGLRSTSRSFSLSPDGRKLAVGDGAAIDLFKIGD